MSEQLSDAGRVKTLQMVRDTHDLLSAKEWPTVDFRRVQECLAWLVAVERDLVAIVTVTPADNPDA